MATWYQYQIELPNKFAGATFKERSVWGNGGAGKDLWGWPNTVPMVEIDGPVESGGKVYILVKLTVPGHSDSKQFALITRVKYSDGTHAVFAHVHDRT